MQDLFISDFVSDILPESFLRSYITKVPPFGFNGLGYIVYKRTYARKLPTGATEEWWQTIARCINGAQKIGADYSPAEAQELFDYMFNLKCTFGGRMLWQLGTSTVDRFGANSLLNCFAYDTEILTDDGIKPIGSLANSTVKLMTQYGKWVESEIKSFGEQELFKLVLSRGKSRKEVLTTKHHRWFRKSRRHGAERSYNGNVESITAYLEPGDKLVSTYGQSVKNLSDISLYGIRHGLVFGDGSVCNNVGQLTLCGEKNRQLLKYFNDHKTYRIEISGDVVVAGLPKYFKERPSLDMDKSYLYGWLAGYFAADGHIKKSGQIRIHSSNKENLLYVRDVCTKLGIGYAPISVQERVGLGQTEPSELFSIDIHGSFLTDDFFLIEEHRKRFVEKEYQEQREWKVETVSPTGIVEEVYCAVVPETRSFVLEGNILTGNCWFTLLSKPEDFCFLCENLMLGGGVGFSIKREHVHELPKVKKGVVVEHIKAKDTDFIVPDSREGWVELLRKVMTSFFESGKGFTYSTILVRGQGEPIGGFGGSASGPQVLVDGITDICKILKSREGKKLRSIDALDIANIIAAFVVAGNVRRCLPEYSMVHTKYGLQNIKNIKIGTEVLTTKGYRHVVNKFYQGKQKTVTIKTQDGEFECTPNHKMAVLNSIHNYEWKMASELCSGDRLISPRIGCDGDMNTELPEWSYNKPKNSTTCQDITIPSLDSPMAWLIGLFQSDGYVFANHEKDGFNAYVSLCLGENEYEIAMRAKEQLERFGVSNVELYHSNDENSWRVRCTSKQLAWYFYKHIKQPKTCLVIPEFIKKSTTNVKLAYISGILDGDGCVLTRPIEIVRTVYKQFAKDIQLLLYSCGIESRFNVCSGNDKREEIGWQPQYSVSLISQYSKKMIKDYGISMKNIDIRSRSQNSNGYLKEWLGCYYPNKQMIVDRYEEQFQTKVEYIPVEVVDIINNENEVETYDIEVEDVHEFFADGYLTHNSAEIGIGDPDDYLFLRAKRWDLGNIPNWRANSNNTIGADSYDQIDSKVWDGFNGNGEPYGFFNLPLISKYGRLKDKMKDNAEGVNPCGEIPLEDKECCNLAEIFIKNIESKEELIRCAILLYKTQKAIAAMPFIHKDTEKIVHKNMRLGGSISGVCQTPDRLSWFDEAYTKLRQFDKEYSAKKGWPESIRLTTVKPSGTVSLLAGSTPGVHPGFAKYYIRRIRMASTDPLVSSCKELGYHIEYERKFDGTEDYNTTVVSFPCSLEGSILSKDMSAIEQLELVVKMQTEWADNSVSVTVYYRKEELDDIKEWMKNNYDKKLKTVSFLLHSEHGFDQAPYEEITEDEYNNMAKKLKPITDIMITSGDLEGIECAGGVCPVK